MPPQPTPGQDPVDPTPPQPPQFPMASAPGVIPQQYAPPQAQPQPQPAQPAPFPQSTTGLPSLDVAKEKKRAMWMVIFSLVIFILGFLFGIAALLGAILGVYGARRAKLVNYNSVFVLGIIGAVLNLGLYLLYLTLLHR